MGCGQSKINLYPRRNKGGGKGHGSKKSAGGDSKDGDEDETSASAGGGPESPRDSGHAGSAAPGSNVSKPRPPPAPPHALGHAASTEISASQVDFFKMLDEKIEKGRDYDSSSETEIQVEQARISSLLQSWDAASQSSQCYAATSSPPTPRSARRSLRSVTPASPPVRRGHHDSNSSIDKDQHKMGSPSKRGAQIPTWKVNPKGQPQPLQMKIAQKLDSCDDQRCYSPQLLTQREIHQSYGISQDYSESSRDSQITYNPTFQSHSPIHVAKSNNQNVISQPYIAQIVTYPISQQSVSHQSAGQKYIAPATTYQPAAPQQQQAQVIPQNVGGNPQQDQQRFSGRIQQNQQGAQPSNIYYIAPTPIIQPQIPSDQILTPKQQTALHLQQYVAMKQAQQAMGYQRMMAGQDYSLYTQGDSPGSYGRKMYDRTDENYSLNFMTLGRQPTTQKAVLQTQVIRPMSPGLMQFQQSQVTVASAQPPSQTVSYQRSQVNPNVFQNTPGCTASLGRNQSALYHKDMMSERFNLGMQCTTGSQQSNPSNPVRSNVCQSINIVTQKTVGQIVPIGTNQDLVIYQNVNDANNSNNVTEFTTFKDVSKSTSDQSELSKNLNKTHIGSTIVGRQVYYSQVISSTAPPLLDSDALSQQKVVNSNSFIMNNTNEMKKSTVDATSKNSVRTIVQNKNNPVDKNGADYL